MTHGRADPLEALMTAMARVDVAPDPDRRGRDIAAARKKFISSQESGAAARHTPASTWMVRVETIQGVVRSMTCKMKKALLYGGTGLISASLGVAMFLTMTDMRGPDDVAEIATGAGKTQAQVGATSDTSDKSGFSANNAGVNPGRDGAGYRNEEMSTVVGRPTSRNDNALTPEVMTRAAPQGILPAPPDAPAVMPEDRDRFPQVEPGVVKLASEAPVSTFSIDVDTASYATIRRWLQEGRLPDPESVRVEEMINYFDFGWSEPGPGGAPFRASVANFETPWNSGTEIVRIGLQGRMPAIDARPPLDLVFLVDTSGSMRSPDKLGLLKTSLKMILPGLRPDDRVGIATYAGSAGVALEMTPASDRAAIEAALESLAAGGSTAGAAGLAQAYDMLESDADRVGRVILATDGDFNVGMSSPDEMKAFIADKRDSGAYLSVLGFGRGNYNDSLMQALAQNGNGQAAYIDTLSEARKVLVDQLAGNLFTIAEDVKIQVEFNPEVVAEYRLIGYETRALRREDFANDRVDAGEIGAGHQVTALYEVTPVGSAAQRMSKLRYGRKESSVPAFTDELGMLRLRYKMPGEDSSKLIETPISRAQEDPMADDRFAMAIAGFGQLLGGSVYLEEWTLADAAALARDGLGEDPFGYRAEAIRLIELAGTLSR